VLEKEERSPAEGARVVAGSLLRIRNMVGNLHGMDATCDHVRAPVIS
jgi:hypothetical protein